MKEMKTGYVSTNASERSLAPIFYPKGQDLYLLFFCSDIFFKEICTFMPGAQSSVVG
jgi:hypothetical protein